MSMCLVQTITFQNLEHKLYFWCVDRPTSSKQVKFKFQGYGSRSRQKINVARGWSAPRQKGKVQQKIRVGVKTRVGWVSFVRSFVRYYGQKSSLLWTPALRPLCRSNAPAQGEEGNW